MPRAFAESWQLEEAELTTPHLGHPDTHLYTRTPRQLQIVIGQDLAHLGPFLLTSYRDQHGFVQVHSCPFSGRLVAAGNCQFPLTSSQARDICRKLSTTGFFGSIQEGYTEEEEGEDITTVAMSMAVDNELPLIPPTTHRARPLKPVDTVDLEDSVDLVDSVEVKTDAGAEPWELTLMEGDGDDMSEAERSKHIVAENRKFLKHGEYLLSPGLRARLEKHTQPTLQPRHRLHPDCKTCNKCMLCKEGAPGYYRTLEKATYKKHISRKFLADFNPPIPPQGIHRMAKYAYEVQYVERPEAEPLPENFETAMARHRSLRKSALSLPAAAKAEFSRRLTQGVP